MCGRLIMAKAIQIDERDNVATVTSDVGVGDVVEVLSPEGEALMRPQMTGEVSFGHKIALKSLEKGEKVVKYGEVIGVASSPIGVGVWMHTHNVESATVPTSAYVEGGA